MGEAGCTFKFSQQAASYFKRLENSTQERIMKALAEAFNDPLNASGHLINRGDERKVRVGGLRILIRIVGDELFVDVILPRGDIYKHTRH